MQASNPPKLFFFPPRASGTFHHLFSFYWEPPPHPLPIRGAIDILLCLREPGAISKANTSSRSSPAPGRAISPVHTKPVEQGQALPRGKNSNPSVPRLHPGRGSSLSHGGSRIRAGLSSAEGLTGQLCPHSFHSWDVTPGSIPGISGASSPGKLIWGGFGTGQEENGNRGIAWKLQPTGKCAHSWRFRP